MDSKNLRIGLYSGALAIVVGTALGTYGGWLPLANQSNNLVGAAIIGLVFSILLAYIFGHYFVNFLPGTPLVKGVIFGILIWLIFLILGNLGNFFKDAVYPLENKETALFLSLVLHTVWGAAVGLFQTEKN